MSQIVVCKSESAAWAATAAAARGTERIRDAKNVWRHRTDDAEIAGDGG